MIAQYLDFYICSIY